MPNPACRWAYAQQARHVQRQAPQGRPPSDKARTWPCRLGCLAGQATRSQGQDQDCGTVRCAKAGQDKPGCGRSLDRIGLGVGRMTSMQTWVQGQTSASMASWAGSGDAVRAKLGPGGAGGHPHPPFRAGPIQPTRLTCPSQPYKIPRVPLFSRFLPESYRGPKSARSRRSPGGAPVSRVRKESYKNG